MVAVNSMKIRAKLTGDMTEIKLIISHPMETGRKKDDFDQLIPAHFIQELVVKHNDKVVVSSNMGAGISKDPYFAFMLKGGQINDKITVSWHDNLGNADTEEHIIQ